MWALWSFSSKILPWFSNWMTTGLSQGVWISVFRIRSLNGTEMGNRKPKSVFEKPKKTGFFKLKKKKKKKKSGYPATNIIWSNQPRSICGFIITCITKPTRYLTCDPKQCKRNKTVFRNKTGFFGFFFKPILYHLWTGPFSS